MCIVGIVVYLGIPNAAADHLYALDALFLLHDHHRGHNLVARQFHFSLHSLSDHLGQFSDETRKIVEQVVLFFHMFLHYRSGKGESKKEREKKRRRGCYKALAGRIFSRNTLVVNMRDC